MLGYSTNSTEFIVLDFESPKLVLAPSTSTFKKNEFPEIPQEVLHNFILNQKNDTSEDENELSINSDDLCCYLSKIETYPKNVYAAFKSEEA